MRKILCALVVIFSLNVCQASFVPSEPTSKAVADVNKAQQDKLLMEQVTKMSVKDYEKMTGKKMHLVDRLAFKTIKKRFEKKLAMSGDNDSEGFNIGGFLLGFFLGLIGALLSFLSKDRNFRKWAFIGWGVSAVILLIVLLAAG